MLNVRVDRIVALYIFMMPAPVDPDASLEELARGLTISELTDAVLVVVHQRR